ncbi:3-hydroxyisobutyrate dehydrogenase [Neofusicoccum parvum]|uniref:3-hydroxyisobutyrate dehydrogenase n=1 Tax=Botryosphaeria parva (strain UCR-NP2) TaxID=1287680 RepID=R1EFT9_BOTPV|nr:putative 3-hydroxyisobutyrate dehydrogenase protein [Neofusicoccum parvum UCRNP2]GME62243.1 3-hydroxyisobutyrate dehydrogenase [Neofusicoccum parvum]
MAANTNGNAGQGAFGFVGLGAMGYPMASHIRRKIPATTPFYVFDLNTAFCEQFAAEFSSHGPVHVAKSARDVAEHASTIVSIVTASPHVRSVYLDETSGVVAAAPSSDRLMLECSTIDFETTREIGKALAEAGRGTYVDTPVSGGVPGAVAGNLAFLIGAEESASFRQRLDAAVGMMGSPEKVFYMGALGNGLGAKLTNNYCAGIINLVTAEALNFGIRAGIDKHALVNAIKCSTGNSFMLEKVCPVPGVDPAAPSSNDYERGFKMFMMPKDIGLAVDMAEKLGARATTGKAALELYKEAASDPKIRDKDASSVYRFLGGPE